MLIYAEVKKDFMVHVRDNMIMDKVSNFMLQKLGRNVSRSEKRSWQNSLTFMRNILDDSDIPDNSGIAIEYNIPQTSNRVDFIISGYDKDNSGNLVIVELKQWDSVELSNLDAHVKLGGNRNMLHPSYQAWSYKAFMEDYNSTIQDEQIGLNPCAYLHNYNEDEDRPVLRNSIYREYLKDAPVFFQRDSVKLRSFIKDFVKYGDNKELLYSIERGKIRPSKNLANSLSSMIQGKKEFILLDQQKTVYETALNLADTITGNKKHVLIVKGGPGTGKTVVAMNLLVELTKREKLAFYVTSNAAPRAVYESKLTGTMAKTRISNLFKGVLKFQDLDSNCFDILIVDEAHRLSARNIMNTYKGNQIRDIINVSKLSVFFLDESQKVLIEDIGTETEITNQARIHNAEVTTLDLPSQFRCNGSDGYIAWLNNILGIRDTANFTLDGIDYDFQVFDTPNEMHNLIKIKNSSSESISGSRVIAGYCWPWNSKKDPQAKDIVIGDYEVQWNKESDGSLWAIKENSINEIGCIHTSQGLEFDYVGVIIGPDLVYEDGEIKTKPLARNKVDANKTLRGYKTSIKSKDPEKVRLANIKADQIIKNTYKVLMTRGQKGCFVYCVDKNLSNFLKNRINLKVAENQANYSLVAEDKPVYE